MAELESAERFERLLREGNESPLPRIMRIEARDADIALRVLTELQFAFAGDLIDLDATKADDIACAFRNAHARLVTKYTAAEPAVETREG